MSRSQKMTPPEPNWETRRLYDFELSDMEFHMKTSGPSRKCDPRIGAETNLEGTTTPLGSTVDNYGAFQSKDPILSISKDNHKSRGDPGHGPDVHHPTSYLETMMHLFKGNVGSGIFALGDAFKNAGLLLAPPLTIVLGIICVHAQHILINCNEEVCRRLGTTKDARQGFAGTVEMCFETGPLQLRKYSVMMRKLVNIFLCATQLGFCCVYFVFISTNMKQVLDGYGFKMNVHLHMIVVLIPIMLSTWIRNLKYLVPVSSIANFLVIAGYVLSIYLMGQDLPPIKERAYVADWRAIPLFFGTVIYSFEGITLVLPLKNEMKTPEKFSKPLGVLNVGMVIVGSMFVLMGFLSYLKYGDSVEGSVTLNLDSSDVVPSWLPQCIQIAISLSILLTYALQFYVPIAITWPSVVNTFGPFHYPVVAEICYRSAVCFLTFILAEAIPQLGLFISLVGAVSSTALALIFPPIMEMVICSQQANTSLNTMIKDLCILLIGVLGCVTGTYQSIASIVEAFSEQ